MYQWITICTYDLKHLADCCKGEWILTKSTEFVKAAICKILCYFTDVLFKTVWSHETDEKPLESGKATMFEIQCKAALNE